MADDPQPLPESGSEEEEEEGVNVPTEAQEMVTSYCAAFDAKSQELEELVTPDVTLQWFGEQEVHGPARLREFLTSTVPDTKHLDITVEQHTPNKPHELHAHGTLEFCKKRTISKSKKAQKWGRRIQMKVCYKHSSHGGRPRINQVVYERVAKCRRMLVL